MVVCSQLSQKTGLLLRVLAVCGTTTSFLWNRSTCMSSWGEREGEGGKSFKRLLLITFPISDLTQKKAISVARYLLPLS